MSGGERGQAKKKAYFAELIKYFSEYSKLFVIGVDHIGSNQLQRIRVALRGKAEILMGKNTLIRKAVRGYVQNDPRLESLLPHISGRVGFVFVKDDLLEVKKILLDHKVTGPAKAGQIAPQDVILPLGYTGLDPSVTSFFQAMNISTRIRSGQIEVVKNVDLIRAGQKVGESEANLLARLNIKPFKWGVSLKIAYEDGSVFPPDFGELGDWDLGGAIRNAVRNIAAVGLVAGHPTIASIPHSISRGYRDVLAISVEADYPIRHLVHHVDDGVNDEVVDEEILRHDAVLDDMQEGDDPWDFDLFG